MELFVRVNNQAIISERIYDTATFGFQNAYKIFSGPCKTCQGIIVGEIMNTLHRKKKKTLKKILNKIRPTIEPCGTPDFIAWNLLFILLIFTIFLVWINRK